jgi:outer membrane receptor protein involved in Fe transport
MPKSMPLAMTFDFYKIKIYDGIDNLDAQVILNNCYNVEALSDYCQYIERRDDGLIMGVDQSLRNMGEIDTSGMDFTFSLGFPLFQNIRGNLGFQGNVLLERKEWSPDDLAAADDDTPQSELITDYTGQIEPMGDSNPKFRFVGSISIGDMNWQLNNRLRYIHSMSIFNVDSAPYTDVDAIAYWDISGSLTFGDFNWIVGCNNVIDKDPPYFPGTGYNGHPQTYDFIGRYIWTNLGYTFH